MIFRNISLLLSLMVLLAGVQTFAQATNPPLSGVIRDTSGVAVPDAKITLKSHQTGAIHEITTDSAGRYNFTNLEPGEYAFRAEHAGFMTAIQDGVMLAAGGARVLNVIIFKKPPSPQPYSERWFGLTIRNSCTASCDGVARGNPVNVCMLSTPSTRISVLSSDWSTKVNRGASAGNGRLLRQRGPQPQHPSSGFRFHGHTFVNCVPSRYSVISRLFA
jgi:hypothetical protein